MRGKKKILIGDVGERLTPKQRRFCELYVIDYNATNAYRQAYPGIKDNKVASVCGSRLLVNVNIQAAISDLERNLSKTIGVSAVRIALEYKKLAFSSIAHMHDTWITRKDFEQLTPDQRACIAEIDTKTIREMRYNPETDKKDLPVKIEYIRIKLYDKLRALEALRAMTGTDEPAKFEVDYTRLSETDLDKIINNLKAKIDE